MINKKAITLKIIIAISAILSVLFFTLYKWETLLRRYGNYGSYVQKSDQAGEFNLGAKFSLQYLDKSATSFEKETIYREAIKYQYEVAFWKIWTFGAFVFTSALLLMILIPTERKT